MREGVRDIAFGAAMLVVAGLLFLETLRPGYRDGGVIGYGFDPGFFPRILLGIWMALAVTVIVRGVLAPDVRVRPRDWKGLAMVVALVAAYVGLILQIGFLFASMLFTAAAMLALGYRRPLVVALITLVFPVVTWYVFVFFLFVPLPTSPWFARM